MKHGIFLIVLLFSFAVIAKSQQSANAYNDSMLTMLLKGIPKSKQEAFKKTYNAMPDDNKRIYEAFALPISSKKELISNIDSSYNNIEEAIKYFTEITGAGFDLYIEFNPPQKILHKGESVDFWCSTIDSSGSAPLFQEWNLELTSSKLDSLLQQVNWDRMKLTKLKAALQKANCISIKNGSPIEVGFARSGMGKYSYLIFEKDLNATQIKQYNDGCSYIFYKNNIVLEYGGGAVGSQCFPYEEE